MPCPDDPTSCDCPQDWYQEFVNSLGKPLSDGIINGYLCNRTFEHANVFVDMNNDTSAVITWM